MSASTAIVRGEESSSTDFTDEEIDELWQKFEKEYLNPPRTKTLDMTDYIARLGNFPEWFADIEVTPDFITLIPKKRCGFYSRDGEYKLADTVPGMYCACVVTDRYDFHAGDEKLSIIYHRRMETEERRELGLSDDFGVYLSYGREHIDVIHTRGDVQRHLFIIPRYADIVKDYNEYYKQLSIVARPKFKTFVTLWRDMLVLERIPSAAPAQPLKEVPETGVANELLDSIFTDFTPQFFSRNAFTLRFAVTPRFSPDNGTRTYRHYYFSPFGSAKIHLFPGGSRNSRKNHDLTHCDLSKLSPDKYAAQWLRKVLKLNAGDIYMISTAEAPEHLHLLCDVIPAYVERTYVAIDLTPEQRKRCETARQQGLVKIHPYPHAWLLQLPDKIFRGTTDKITPVEHIEYVLFNGTVVTDDHPGGDLPLELNDATPKP